MELATLRELLGISGNDKDLALQFVIDDVTETILNYCNLEELPAGLIRTAYRMAIDLYRSEAIGSEEAPIGQVTSISEGDSSTSFANRLASGTVFNESILKNYTKTLNRFRKVGFC